MHGAFDEIRNSLVRHWGEMSGYWGINRTMAEIHALLFISTQPLCTDDIMEQLQISRGNASMNLRGLVDWGLIRRVHKFGDRKEYFQADTDVWHMFETIMRERRRREVEPIVATIDRCLEVVQGPLAHEADPQRIAECRRRLENLRGFLTGMSKLFEAVLRFGAGGVADLVRLLDAPQAPAASGPAPAMPAEPARPPAAARAPHLGPAAGAGAGSAAPGQAGKPGKLRPRPAKTSRSPASPKPSAYKRRPREGR